MWFEHASRDAQKAQAFYGMKALDIERVRIVQADLTDKVLLDLGIRYESLEAVPATRHGYTPPFPHRLLYRRYRLIGRADEPDIVRARS